MKSFIFDADILSTFAKIENIVLLKKVFRDELLIPPAVIDDLERSKLQSLKNIKNSSSFKHIFLTQEEQDLVQRLQKKKLLGKGELECIALAHKRMIVLVSNDKKAISIAEQLGITVIDLETILFYLKEILSKQELSKIMSMIEEKDKVIIRKKDQLLS
ncbi:hypothetical protein J4410_07215 [Candidatus Woesearchaeota archaeon]|nr:hypothetical protein [Candidatus Woesearchaeota archaeon]